METNQYLKMLREIKSVAFSTVDEEGKPHSRIADVMIVEDNKVYFTTARGKDFAKHLKIQPYIAIVALTKDYQMIQLEGKVMEMDESWMKKIIEANPMVSDLYPKDAINILNPYCLYEGHGTFFDLLKKPVEFTAFSVGEGEATFIRPKIDERCIGCNICRKNCPTGCIIPGKPYVIKQKNCMNCGFCIENCPVSVITLQKI